MTESRALVVYEPPPTKVTFIYGLSDQDDVIRYVGKADSPVARLQRHFWDMKRRKTPLYHWLRKLLKAGRAPKIHILEQTEAWESKAGNWKTCDATPQHYFDISAGPTSSKQCDAWAVASWRLCLRSDETKDARRESALS